MKNVRYSAIIEFLKDKKYCKIPDLREYFGVSNATIHRDIDELEKRGVIRKMRGAIALGTPSAQPTVPPGAFPDRQSRNRRSKEFIAGRAMELINDGDILFLDSSTTVSFLADKLVNSNFTNLTIVTNAVSVIQDFHKFPAHYVLIGLGGSFDLQLNAFLGQSTIRELEQLSISKVFVSAFGICDQSVTTNNEKHFALLYKLMDIAEHKVLLIDHSKINRKGLFRFANEAMFDSVITDQLL